MIFGELSQNGGGDGINLLEGTRYFSYPWGVTNPTVSYIDDDGFAVAGILDTWKHYINYTAKLDKGMYTIAFFAKAETPTVVELKTESGVEHQYHQLVSSNNWKKYVINFSTKDSEKDTTLLSFVNRYTTASILIKKVCLHKGVEVNPIWTPSIYELASTRDLVASGRNLILGSYRNKDSNTFMSNGSIEKGSGSIKLTYHQTISSGILVPISKDYAQYKGVFTLSFLYKGTVNIDFPVIYFFKENEEHILFNRQKPISPANSWTKYVSIVDTREKDISDSNEFLFAYGIGDGNELEIKSGSLKLEPGPIATDWSPAIEDVRNATVEGFGENLLVNVNLNNVTDNGIYQLNGAISNNPGWNIGGLIVFTYYNSTRQFSWDAASNVVKTRVCHDGAWTDWKAMTVL